MQQLLNEVAACFDPMPAPVLLAGPAGGAPQVVYRNPAARALVAGRDAELLAALAPVLADGASRWNGVLWGIDLAARIAPYRAGMTVILLRDMTEDLQRQQQQIDASKAALQSALDAANAANSAKTDFLSSMSHDIRTPLNAIGERFVKRFLRDCLN